MLHEDETCPSRLAEEVKNRIVRSRLNLYRLSQEIKIDYAKIRDFMNGETGLPRSSLLKLAGKVGVSMQQIGKY